MLIFTTCYNNFVNPNYNFDYLQPDCKIGSAIWLVAQKDNVEDQNFFFSFGTLRNPKEP